jgi:HAE1 family hydrophobic/amphiphilic exporter-1
MVFATALSLVALASFLSLQLGAELIPPLTQGEFTFEIKLPEGTPIETTNEAMVKIEKQAARIPGVATVFSSVGGSTENQFARNAQKENFAQLYVVLSDKRNRLVEEQVIGQLRQELGQYPELTYTFGRPTLFSFKTPIEVEVFAFDLNLLKKAAESITQSLDSVSGLSDIKASTELGNPEIRVRFDREKLARFGLDESEISNVLRNKIRGEVATRYREEDRQIDILVRTEESDRRTVEDLKNLVVNAPSASLAPSAAAGSSEAGSRADFAPVHLAAVAQITMGRGPSEIHRIRSQRAAIVSANLSGRALSSVSREIETKLDEVREELGSSTTIVLAGQNEELATSQQSLIFALCLAIFLVYLVMASQFESLVHPFIILFTVPLGMIGVVFALFLTNTTISVMVFLGVIILSGIVVNNAIVLIDYTNQLRRTGIGTRDAILKAGQVRLRPIVMTTLTTVLGLIPMALAWGEGAEIRAPMALTVIGGLLFSTLLTLILIPVLYELIDRKVYAAEAVPDSIEDHDFSRESSPGFSPATGE